MACPRIARPVTCPQRRIALVVGLLGLLGLLTGARGATNAGTVQLATGEYLPLVGEQLPQGGVTAAIVRAAFKTQGVDTEHVFLPWKRGLLETGGSKYLGTFPYLKTAEREVEFLYSQPIYADHFRLFARKDTQRPRDWYPKVLCIPLGYDTTQVQPFTQQHRIRLEHPPEIDHCFKMLQVGRVDAVWVSQLVGSETRHRLFGKNSDIEALNLKLNLVGSTDYFLILSRSHPDAQSWLQRFDAGLKRIKEDGTYQRILTRFKL